MNKLFQQFPLGTPIGDKLWYKSITFGKRVKKSKKPQIHQECLMKDPKTNLVISYTIYVYSNQMYVKYDDEKNDIYYLMSSDDLVEVSSSIPECDAFIKSCGSDIYNRKKHCMDNFRIKHLLSFSDVECGSKILFTQKIPGQPGYTTKKGHKWHSGTITVYENYSFRVDYDGPSVLSVTDENPVLFHIGKLAFTPSNWKANTNISTIIYYNWHLNINMDRFSEKFRIHSIHRDLECTTRIATGELYLTVTFPKTRIINELLQLINGKITLEQCCEFTQILKTTKISVEALEKQYEYSENKYSEFYSNE